MPEPLEPALARLRPLLARPRTPGAGGRRRPAPRAAARAGPRRAAAGPAQGRACSCRSSPPTDGRRRPRATTRRARRPDAPSTRCWPSRSATGTSRRRDEIAPAAGDQERARRRCTGRAAQPTRPSRPSAHDRAKQHLLDPGDPLFAALGADADKRRQVDAFLRQLVPPRRRPSSVPRAEERPLRVVDLGCGNAYLTFAAHRYLAGTACPRRADARRRRPARPASQRNTALAGELGWTGLTFAVGTIDGGGTLERAARRRPRAARLRHGHRRRAGPRRRAGGRRVVLAAPCCHHDVQRQLDEARAAGLTRRSRTPRSSGTPILRERFADVLTDTLRARCCGCTATASTSWSSSTRRHTPRNALLRAAPHRARPATEAPLARVRRADRRLARAPRPGACWTTRCAGLAASGVRPALAPARPAASRGPRSAACSPSLAVRRRRLPRPARRPDGQRSADHRVVRAGGQPARTRACSGRTTTPAIRRGSSRSALGRCHRATLRLTGVPDVDWEAMAAVPRPAGRRLARGRPTSATTRRQRVVACEVDARPGTAPGWRTAVRAPRAAAAAALPGRTARRRDAARRQPPPAGCSSSARACFEPAPCTPCRASAWDGAVPGRPADAVRRRCVPVGTVPLVLVTDGTRARPTATVLLRTYGDLAAFDPFPSTRAPLLTPRATAGLPGQQQGEGLALAAGRPLGAPVQRGERPGRAARAAPGRHRGRSLGPPPATPSPAATRPPRPPSASSRPAPAAAPDGADGGLLRVGALPAARSPGSPPSSRSPWRPSASGAARRTTMTPASCPAIRGEPRS